jgi:hypothetical protein
MANAKQAIEVMDRIRVDLTTALSNRRFGQFHRERRDCRGEGDARRIGHKTVDSARFAQVASPMADN